MAIDPVCLMEVEEATAQWTSEYEGQTYYFCAPGCKVSFDENPEKYLNGGGNGDHDHGHATHHNASSDHLMQAADTHAPSNHSGHDHSGDHEMHDHNSDDHH